MKSTANKPRSTGFRMPLQIRIEAKGYLPTETRNIPTDQDDVTLDFKLKQAADIIGLVPVPDRAPAVNAEVALRGPSDRIDIGNGELNRQWSFPIYHNGSGRPFQYRSSGRPIRGLRCAFQRFCH